MMKRCTRLASKTLAAVLSMTLVCAAANAQLPNPQLEKDQKLAKARDAYYNLRRLGLVEFRANLQPNWDLLLTGIEQKESAIKLLNGLHFSVSIDKDSKFQVTSRVNQPLNDPKTAEDLGRIVRATDSALKQFFATWSLFMLTSPFPAVGSEYDVSQELGQFRFSHREAESQVLTITDRNFMVIEIRVSAPTYNGWLKPVFERTPTGFVLKSFEASNVTQTGPRITSVKTKLEYAEVNGLHLLQKVNVDTVQNGFPAQMEWLFTDYQVKIR